ncbi:MAG: PAS domain-containing protein [Merismopedia sp. SIO2A8]|nr:PAS domain-containing protein [Merismopedia sp. SIO2A8]
MDVFGFFPEALKANSHLMFNRVHPEDSDSLRASMLYSAQTLNPWNWEGRIVLPTGQLKWLEGRAQPSYEADTQVVWDGVFIDVTVTKQREQALQAIVESTTPRPEQTFFQACAQAIATALQMQYVLISEIQTWDESDVQKVSSLVFWQGDSFGESVTYDLADTPCSMVFQKDDIYHCDSDVQQKFPADHLLTEIGVTSYAGIPIHDASGAIMGHIAVMDAQPLLHDCSLLDYVLRIFATRVGTELSRQRAADALQQSEMRLRQQTQELEKALIEVQHSHAHMMQSEKMSSLGALLAGVAHDIKNPVGFIYGNVRHATSYVQDLLELINLYRTHYPNPNPLIQDLLEEVDVDFVMEDLPKALASMQLGADTIKQIVKSLGNFSRMDESEKQLNNLHDGLDCTIMILQNRLQGKPSCPA